jgi:hypothetical protein
MRMLTSCLAAVASCCAFAAAACETPAMVAIPADGKTATEAEMLAAQAQVKAYVAAMNDYVACIKALMITRHNAAVNEIESVAAAFNEQIKAYRAANAAPAAN